jgi:hypothetical protein
MSLIENEGIDRAEFLPELVEDGAGRKKTRRRA